MTDVKIEMKGLVEKMGEASRVSMASSPTSGT